MANEVEQVEQQRLEFMDSVSKPCPSFPPSV